MKSEKKKRIYSENVCGKLVAACAFNKRDARQ
jgi:hypothetical protein